MSFGDDLAQRRAAWRIGKADYRLEDDKLLRGAGCYIGDLTFPGEAHCAFVRSSRAHAAIRAIDTAEAKAAPGVLCVLTGADVAADGLGGIPWEVRPPGDRYATLPMGSAEGASPQPLMACGRIRFVGEIVALVVAETALQAQSAAELVHVDCEPLPVVAGLEAAMRADAVQIWPEAAGNVAFSFEDGEARAVERALSAAPVRVSGQYRNRRLAGVPIEVRGYVGMYDAARETYVLHACAAKPHPIRDTMAKHVFNELPERIEVRVPNIGGGFGTKNVLYPEECLVLWAARKTGRPVKWLGTRSESFLSDMAGRDQFDQGDMAFDENGAIVAFRARCISNLGAYLAPRGAVPVRNSHNVMSSVYRIPLMHFEGVGVYTHTTPTCSLRGSGQPEMMYLIEQLLDRGARALGMDRVEIRRRNLIPAAAFPYTTPFGITYDTGSPSDVMNAALAAADMSGFAERRKASQARGLLRGIGFANCIEALIVFYNEKAWLRPRADGRIECLIGTQSSGQGHATSFAQIVAGKLGVPLDWVLVVEGDTRRIPQGNGTGASRSISSGGSAVALAVDDFIARAGAFIAELHGVPVETISFRDGGWEAVGTNLRLTVEDVAAEAARAGRLGELHATGAFSPRDGTFPYGCHVCEVEVDPETGAVSVQSYSTAHDIGLAVSPALVEGQVHGSVVQGLGQALFEEQLYDEQGQPLAASLLDYGIPRADQASNIAVGMVEIPCRNNPLGSKGIGESGTLGAPPAIISAILDALAPLGVEDVEMPATPLRVWQAIEATRQKNRSRCLAAVSTLDRTPGAAGPRTAENVGTTEDLRPTARNPRT